VVLGTREKPDQYQEDAMDQNQQPMTMSVTDAAKRLGISRAFAYELVARGELPCLRFGRRVVVPRKALERLVDAAEHGTRSTPATR
jgi:excisionase family DNA binding protein